MNSTVKHHSRARKLGLVMATLLAMTLVGCGAQEQIPEVKVTETGAPPGDRTQPLTLIAHRSAWRVYPESSAEAVRALSDTEYPIEFDLRPLSDGTLVPSHDPLADRSMEGVQGPLTELSIAQWEAAKVRSQDGSTLGTPTTWEEILDGHVPGTMLFPELKRPTPELAPFADSILSRGIQDSVVVQTFDYPTAQQLAAAGLQTLILLLGDMPDPQQLKNDGINYVGVSRDLPVDYIASLKDAGLTVYVYIVNRTERLIPFLDAGIDGVFTDDPWKLEAEIIDDGLFDE